jgi:hypothetical protein
VDDVDATIERLLTANLMGVFGERDAAKRHAVSLEIYADDVTFTDPEGTEVGRDALEAKAAALLEAAPGFVFATDGPGYSASDQAALAWQFGPEGSEPVARGVDVITVVDGRIVALRTMLAGA